MLYIIKAQYMTLSLMLKAWIRNQRLTDHKCIYFKNTGDAGILITHSGRFRFDI